jgi:DnaJ-class molecular chaperone
MFDRNISIETSTIRDFFKLRLDKVITSEDTITRCRRAVQEYYPETRGLKYKARQSKQIEVIDNLKENKNLAKKLVISQKTEVCDFCQGSGKYESYTCNVCMGQGHIVIK